MSRKLNLVLTIGILFTTLVGTLAYFIYQLTEWPQDIEVGTIVISINGNSDIRVIESKETNLIQPGDEYDLLIDVGNVGVSAFSFDVYFNLIDDTDANLLAKVMEVHQVVNGKLRFIGMLDALIDSDALFSGILSSGEQSKYELKLVYSAGAGESYMATDFRFEVEGESVMILDSELKTEYGLFYIINDSSLVAAINTIQANQANYTARGITPRLKLLTNVELSRDIIFPAGIMEFDFDLNGRVLDLFGHNLRLNYTATSAGKYGHLVDSVGGHGADCIVNTDSGRGIVTISSPNSFTVIDPQFFGNAYIDVDNIVFNKDVIIAHVGALLDSDHNRRMIADEYLDDKYYSTLSITNDIEFYLANNLVSMDFGTQNNRIRVRANNYPVLIEQTEFTNMYVEVDFTLGFPGDATTRYFHTSLFLVGSGAESLAQLALDELPDVLSASIYLTRYNPFYNAYYTWVFEKPWLFNEDGIHLPLGHSELDTFISEKTKVTIIVNQNGNQSRIEKEVVVVIYNARERTHVLNPTVLNEVVLQYEGEIYDPFALLTDDTLFDKTGFDRVEIDIDEEMNDYEFEEDGVYLEVDEDGYLKVVIKPPFNYEIIDVTFRYYYQESLDSPNLVFFEITKPVKLVGIAETDALSNPELELVTMLPIRDTYIDYPLLSTLSTGLEVTYEVPTEFKDYFFIESGVNPTTQKTVPFLMFKKANIPNYTSTVYIYAYVKGNKYTLNFRMTGLVHNDNQDVPDENLFKELIKSFDGVLASTYPDYEPKDNWLTVNELAQNVGTLVFGNKSIEIIKGIEFCTGTTHIQFNGNLISDVSPLATMYQLRDLRFQSNRIADVTPLAYLDKLTYLDLSSNLIVDFSAIQYLPVLDTLRLNSNVIIDYAPAQNINTLAYLYATGNAIYTSNAVNRYNFVMACLLNTRSGGGTYTIDNGSFVSTSLNAFDVAAATVLSSIKEVTALYDIVNLPTSFIYQGLNYTIKWDSSNLDILRIEQLGQTLTYSLQNNISDINIKLYATVSLGTEEYSMRRDIPVNVKASSINQLYLEDAQGQLIPLEVAIPDLRLRNHVFSVYNTSNATLVGGVSGLFVLSQEEISACTALDLNNMGIVDVQGLSHLTSLQELILFNNAFLDQDAALREINKVLSLTTLALNNHLFDFSLLTDLVNLSQFSVYGSYLLDDETVLTGLYDVYERNFDNAIVVYKDSASIAWKPWEIPIYRAYQMITPVFTFKKLGSIDFFNLVIEGTTVTNNGFLVVRGYGRVIDDAIKLRMTRLGTTDSKANETSYYTLENGNGTTQIFNYIRYVSTSETTFYQANINAALTLYACSLIYTVCIRIELNDDLVMEIDDDRNTVPFHLAVANPVLRRQVLRYFNLGDSNVITREMLAALPTGSNSYVIDGVSDIYDENGIPVHPFKGLEYMPRIQYLTIYRLPVVTGSVGNSLSNITSINVYGSSFRLSWLLGAKDSLTDLVLTNNYYVDITGDVISQFTSLTNFRVISCHQYSMSWITDMPVSIKTLYLTGNESSTHQATKDYLRAWYLRVKAAGITEVPTIYIENTTTIFDPSVDEDRTAELFAAYKENIYGAPVLYRDGQGNLKNATDHTANIGAESIVRLYSGYKLLLPMNFKIFVPNPEQDLAAQEISVPVFWYYRIGAQNSSLAGVTLPYSSNVAVTTGGVTKRAIDLYDEDTTEVIDGIKYQVIDITVQPQMDIYVGLICIIGTSADDRGGVTGLTYANSKHFFYGFIVAAADSLVRRDSRHNQIYFNVTNQTLVFNKERTLTYITISEASSPDTKTNINYYSTNTPDVSMVFNGQYYSYRNFHDPNLALTLYFRFAHTTGCGYAGFFTKDGATGMDNTAGSLGQQLFTPYLSNMGLKSLEGIQMFRRLNSLRVQNNQLEDISPLRFMDYLVSLTISHNPIKSIEPLKGCTSLTDLVADSLPVDTLEDGSTGKTVFASYVHNLKTVRLQNNPKLDYRDLMMFANDIKTAASNSALTEFIFWGSESGGTVEHLYAQKFFLESVTSKGGLATATNAAIVLDFWELTNSGTITPSIMISRINYTLNQFRSMYEMTSHDFADASFRYTVSTHNVPTDVNDLQQIALSKTTLFGVVVPHFDIHRMIPSGIIALDVRTATMTATNYFSLEISEGDASTYRRSSGFHTIIFKDYLLFNYPGVSTGNPTPRATSASNTYKTASKLYLSGNVYRVPMYIYFFDGVALDCSIILNFAGSNSIYSRDYRIENVYAPGTYISLNDRNYFPDATFSNLLIEALITAHASYPGDFIFPIATVNKVITLKDTYSTSSTEYRLAYSNQSVLPAFARIQSLEGLKYFPLVRTVHITGSNIKDLPTPYLNQGTHNTTITTLYLADADFLTDISNIKYFRGLLYLSFIKRAKIDFTNTAVDIDGVTRTFAQLVARLPNLTRFYYTPNGELNSLHEVYSSPHFWHTYGLFGVPVSQGARPLDQFTELFIYLSQYDTASSSSEVNGSLTYYNYKTANYGYYYSDMAVTLTMLTTSATNAAAGGNASNLVVLGDDILLSLNIATSKYRDILTIGEEYSLPSWITYYNQVIHLEYVVSNATLAMPFSIEGEGQVTFGSITIYIWKIERDGLVIFQKSRGRSLGSFTIDAIESGEVQRDLVESPLYVEVSNGVYLLAEEVFANYQLALLFFNHYYINGGTSGTKVNTRNQALRTFTYKGMQVTVPEENVLTQTEILSVSAIGMNSTPAGGTAVVERTEGLSYKGLEIFKNATSFSTNTFSGASLEPFRNLSLTSLVLSSQYIYSSYHVKYGGFTTIDVEPIIAGSRESLTTLQLSPFFLDYSFITAFVNLTTITIPNLTNNIIQLNGFSSYMYVVNWFNYHKPGQLTYAATPIIRGYYNAVQILSMLQFAPGSPARFVNNYLIDTQGEQTVQLPSQIEFGGNYYGVSYISRSAYLSIDGSNVLTISEYDYYYNGYALLIARVYIPGGDGFLIPYDRVIPVKPI